MKTVIFKAIVIVSIVGKNNNLHQSNLICLTIQWIVKCYDILGGCPGITLSLISSLSCLLTNAHYQTFNAMTEHHLYWD